MTTYFREFNPWNIKLNADATPDFEIGTDGGVNIGDFRFRDANAVAAAGAAQGTAAALGLGLNVVSGASGTNGVILPAPTKGRAVFVRNTAAATALLVYPPTGVNINALAANASFSQAGATGVWYVANGTQWFTT